MLASVFPLLENMGFSVQNEMTFCINPERYSDSLWISDLALEVGNTAVDISKEMLAQWQTFL